MKGALFWAGVHYFFFFTLLILSLIQLLGDTERNSVGLGLVAGVKPWQKGNF